MAYTYIKKSLKMTGLYISYNQGGIFDQDGEKGISHLMEHLICENIKQYMPELTKYNIDWNAYTADNITVVHFTALDKYFTSDFKRKIVNALISKLNVSEERFEQEKAVVIQEYLDSFNNPTTCLNALRKHFNYYAPIGKLEDIQKFTYKQAIEKFNKFYKNPANIIEIGPSKTDFSGIKYNDKLLVQPFKFKYKDDYKVELQQTPNNEKSRILCVSKKIVKKSDYFPLLFSLNMLCGGLESPMMTEIREKRHLTYGVHFGMTNSIDESILYLTATTDKKNKNALIDAFKMFYEDIGKWLEKETFENHMLSTHINVEENKIFQYEHPQKYMLKGYIGVGTSWKKVTYEKAMEVAKKYLTLDNMKIIEI